MDNQTKEDAIFTFKSALDYDPIIALLFLELTLGLRDLTDHFADEMKKENMMSQAVFACSLPIMFDGKKAQVFLGFNFDEKSQVKGGHIYDSQTIVV